MSIVMSIDFKERNVYIAGGGSVAYRKVKRFRKEGANVYVIAPDIDERILAMPDIHVIHSSFSWEDVQDAFFIYAATDDEGVNTAIINEAKKRNILCGCAMRNVNSDTHSMMEEEQENIQFALSTKGNCPGADRVFLEQLQPQLQNMNKKSRLLKTIRTYALQHIENKQTLAHVIRVIASWNLLYIEKIVKAIHGKQVVLLAYHGIADVKSIQTQLHEMEDQCETCYSDICAISVFISEKITKKAQQKGQEILHCHTISDCLEALQLSYAVQPMLLNTGTWLKQLQIWYPHVEMGDVVCSSEKAVEMLYQQLKVRYPQGILLGLYHDSDGTWTYPSFPFQTGDHFFAYEELSQVHIQNQDIHVVALSMFAGYHVKKDVLNTWVPYLEAQGNNVMVHTEGCMTYPFIQEWLLQNIARMLENI